MRENIADWTIWLDGPEADTAQVGGKAASIARLRGLGFPAPRAFAVTISALRVVITANNLQPAIDAFWNAPAGPAKTSARVQLQDALAHAEIPQSLRDAIAAARLELAGPVAVRSSGVLEDGLNSSYAGAFDTFLSRGSLEDVLAAVRNCWSSGLSERVEAYIDAGGAGIEQALPAVVVQEMVLADKAGVIFTREPLGASEVLLIEAVAGGCEKLVSGQPADLTLWVDRERRMVVRVQEPAPQARIGFSGNIASALRGPRVLRTREIDQVVALGLGIEQAFGAPQDIEWAFRGRELFVLQARPLTAWRREAS